MVASGIITSVHHAWSKGKTTEDKTQMKCIKRKRYKFLDFTACAIKLEANRTASWDLDNLPKNLQLQLAELPQITLSVCIKLWTQGRNILLSIFYVKIRNVNWGHKPHAKRILCPEKEGPQLSQNLDTKLCLTSTTSTLTNN